MSVEMVAIMMMKPKSSMLQSKEEAYVERSDKNTTRWEGADLSFEELSELGQLDEDSSIKFFGIFMSLFLLTTLLGFWVFIFWLFHIFIN